MGRVVHLLVNLMLMRKGLIPIIIGMLALIGGCELGPGEGGRSAITGKVFMEEYNSAGSLIKDYYIADERVYIIYDDGDTYHDEFRTSFDGSYRFEFLRKGNYRIFAYSECLGCPGSTEPSIIEISIDKNGEEIVAEDIVIKKWN